MAGFFGQALSLIVGGLRVIAGALELLLAGFDAREHGIERFGEAADFVMITARGAQGVVLFTGDLTRQLFKFMDRRVIRRLICRAITNHSSTLKIRMPRLAVKVPV